MRFRKERIVQVSRRASWLRLGTLLAVLLGSHPVAASDCDVDNGGLRLPEGFCAKVFAEDIGPVRNLAISAEGDVFAALRARTLGTGGVLSLRDTDGDGQADERHRFGRGSGHGIALRDGYLYYAAHDEVVRWPWKKGQLEPKGSPEKLIVDFPKQRSHREKAIALGPDGELWVSVGAPSNACQEKSRTRGSPGRDPCPQLELQAGVWKYAADVPEQNHGTGERISTGLRHTLAMTFHPGRNELWGAVNGRDQLGALWGFSAEENAELPGEELVLLSKGSDYGWPYCYHDPILDKKVLAPEYGGDGKKAARCADAAPPALSFPAHWAPMAMAFYEADAFPEPYRGGLFVAFRGSWNRAPLPQQGFRVVFVRFDPSGRAVDYDTFAIGAEDENRFRMTGVTVGPDGSLYISDDTNQRIWKIQSRPSS